MATQVTTPLYCRHWLQSSAGAEPGLVGRSAHGLRERSAMKQGVSFPSPQPPPPPTPPHPTTPTRASFGETSSRAANAETASSQSLSYPHPEGWGARPPSAAHTKFLPADSRGRETGTRGTHCPPPCPLRPRFPALWTPRPGQSVAAAAPSPAAGGGAAVAATSATASDCGCSQRGPGPEHSQLMANDVRPRALSRLPVASRASPGDRLAAPAALRNQRFPPALPRRSSPLSACPEQE
nr:lysine-specific demethylase 6B-like [Vulpes vulpes]